MTEPAPSQRRPRRGGRPTLEEAAQLDQEVRECALRLFLENLDPHAYQTDFATEGSSNYAFTLVLKEPDAALCERVMKALRAHGIEFRRGTAGGGNQVRQPYLRRVLGPDQGPKYPQADHVHFYGFYIGNYPSLQRERILQLCGLLNGLV